MGWQFTVWMPPLTLAGLVTLALGGRAVLYYRRYPDKTYLLAFTATMVAISVWEFTTVFIEASTSLRLKLLANDVLTAVVVPLVLYSVLWFALAYTDNENWLDWKVLAVVVVHVGGVSLASAVVPSLFYTGKLVTATQPAVFGITFGPHLALERDLRYPFLALQLYSYALMLATAAVLTRFLFRQRDRIYWGQAVALGGGILLPVVVNALVFAGVTRPRWHLTELSLLGSSVGLAVGVFRYSLLDLVPTGRAAVIEEMRDGFVVCNAEGVVLDYNPAAGRFLNTDDGTITGEPLAEMLPPVASLLNDGETMETEFEVDVGTDTVSLRASISRIGGGGSLVTLHDVTERKAYERSLEDKNRKLELLNRVVRHDIGNDMTVVAGHAELLDRHIDEAGRDHLDTVRSRTDHVIELTSVLRDLMRTMLDDEALEPVRLDAVLETELAAIDDSNDAVVVDIDGSLSDVTVSANAMLSSVFGNILENAVQHTDTDVPEITVGVTENEDTVVVRIADDGPGIPPAKRDRIFGQGEMGLESSGTGIGLYLVETLVTDFGGDVWVEPNEPRGAVFNVELPKVE